MQKTAKEDSGYPAAQIIVKNDSECTVYGFAEAPEKARLTAYPVFPGIELIYNDIHSDLRLPVQNAGKGFLVINHCHEGRMEVQSGSESFFLAPGDLSVSRLDTAATVVRYPTGHYHGITVRIDTARSPDCLSCFMQDVNVRISTLAEKFCTVSPWFAARSSASIEHVFSELYRVPPEIRRGYFKVKILELLLFLSALPVEQSRQSYSRAQVGLARGIGDYLMENTASRITITELSRRFGASPSLINASFRGVYGMTPGAFLRAQKMHAAAGMLRGSDRTVLDIANQFGYDNASKFAKAFRDVIGVTPNSYRAGIEMDSCAPSKE
jgi:AraC-like DNA-binding protein